MTTRHAMILGNGGHASSVRDVMLSASWTVCSAFELDVANGRLVSVRHDCKDRHDRNTNSWVLAVGDNALRQFAYEFILQGFEQAVFPKIISPLASISPSATIEDGAVVMPFAHVGPESHVGRFVIANTGSIIEHHSEALDFAHVAPGAVLLGGSKVGAGSLIGCNSAVDAGAEFPPKSALGAAGFFKGRGGALEGTYAGSPAEMVRPRLQKEPS
jgi:acetyltransferase-like isoleucine patch superfamily enzyme